ncbi:MAG: hypothetical protein JWQ22_802 [Devosia sp.]|nr:hypothetical protein [Devosia sp.]
MGWTADCPQLGGIPKKWTFSSHDLASRGPNFVSVVAKKYQHGVKRHEDWSPAIGETGGRRLVTPIMLVARKGIQPFVVAGEHDDPDVLYPRTFQYPLARRPLAGRRWKRLQQSWRRTKRTETGRSKQFTQLLRAGRVPATMPRHLGGGRFETANAAPPRERRRAPTAPDRPISA